MHTSNSVCVSNLLLDEAAQRAASLCLSKPLPPPLVYFRSWLVSLFFFFFWRCYNLSDPLFVSLSPATEGDRRCVRVCALVWEIVNLQKENEYFVCLWFKDTLEACARILSKKKGEGRGPRGQEGTHHHLLKGNLKLAAAEEAISQMSAETNRDERGKRERWEKKVG